MEKLLINGGNPLEGEIKISGAKKTLKSGELKKQLEILNNEFEKLKEKNIRLLAEFDNYRRRSVNERQNLSKYSAESFVKDLLPILDDFERTLHNVKDDNPLFEGVQMIKNKLEKMLEEHGIVNFDSIGEVFDPNLHQAMLEIEDENKEPGIIVQEIQKGFIMKDRLLRPSLVAVSKKPTKKEKESEEVKKDKKNQSKTDEN